jgi:hypothetical protein
LCAPFYRSPANIDMFHGKIKSECICIFSRGLSLRKFHIIVAAEAVVAALALAEAAVVVTEAVVVVAAVMQAAAAVAV